MFKVNNPRLLNSVFLIVIVAAGALLRVLGVWNRGIYSSDCFQYIEMAYDWMNGHMVFSDGYSSDYFRPTAYLLNGWAMSLFGVNIYSIKVMNIILDTLTIILTWAVTYKISKNIMLSMGTALVYAFAGSPIVYSNSELLHTQGAFFVMLSFLLFVLSCDDYIASFASKVKLFLSGAVMGLAATTHEDLGLLGPVYCILIVLVELSASNIKLNFKAIVMLACKISIYCFGFWLVLVGWAILAGFEDTIALLFRSNAKGQHFDRLPLQTTWLLISASFLRNLNRLTLILFALSPIIMIWYFIKRKEFNPLACAPLLLIFGYYVFFELLVYRNRIIPLQRLIMPLYPLIIISILYWIHELVKIIAQRPHIAKCSVLIISCLLAWQLSERAIDKVDKYYLKGQQGQEVALHAILKDKVNDNNKLLIAPYLSRRHKPIWTSVALYGANVKYIDMYSDPLQPLQSIIEKEKIRYIYVSNTINKKILKFKKLLWQSVEWPEKVGGRTTFEPGAVFGMNRETYSPEKDRSHIMAFLNDIGATLILKNQYGILYRLPE